jgi:hypothetical protein
MSLEILQYNGSEKQLLSAVNRPMIAHAAFAEDDVIDASEGVTEARRGAAAE